MLDADGFRPNVGIILTNAEGRVFWARRVGQNAWQFPQGGINRGESPLEAMYRELAEETGLAPEHVEVLGSTAPWLRYRLPSRFIRRNRKPLCVGQKQIWFMLRLLGDDDCVKLDSGTKPEFDEWCWVDYWHPMTNVIFFKRDVYLQALRQFFPVLFPQGQHARHRRSDSISSG